MTKKPQLQILSGGYVRGTWKGKPVNAPAKAAAEQTIENNADEDPMMPPILDEVAKPVTADVTAKKKSPEINDDEDKLLPIII